MLVKSFEQKVYEGYAVTKADIMHLAQEDVDDLVQAANRIRSHFCGNHFDLCSIINGKSGKCSENCAFCAQSIYHKSAIEKYPLLPKQEVLKQAIHNDQKGVHRFSIVTSGRSLSNEEIEKVCDYNNTMKMKTNLSLCASHGLLTLAQFKKLKASGVSRYHNNLETSRRYFADICTTHTYDDKIQALHDAKSAGLQLCSGGIFGLGETIEDRIDMAFILRELGVRSIPINILNAIKGTPCMHQPRLSEEEIGRSVALYRFILPKADIRLAGGRGLLSDFGKQLFLGGANASITGDMLTTDGISIDTDKELLTSLGYLL